MPHTNHGSAKYGIRYCRAMNGISARLRDWRETRIMAAGSRALDSHALRDIGIDRTRIMFPAAGE